MVSKGQPDALTRFMSHVEFQDDGCIVWTGARTSRGYGSFGSGDRGGRTVRAHRWYWEFTNGGIPEGLVLDHLCRNKLCVNPEHLEPVSDEENRRRHFLLRTHCKNGHLLDTVNTVHVGSFGRRCRICKQDSASVGKYRAMTGAEVDEIQQLLASGLPISQIANRTGRSIGTIRNIIRRGKSSYANRTPQLRKREGVTE